MFGHLQLCWQAPWQDKDAVTVSAHHIVGTTCERCCTLYIYVVVFILHQLLAGDSWLQLGHCAVCYMYDIPITGTVRVMSKF